ncbi:MAG: phosphate ABC transporter permease PstA [Roseiflexaceae bacterium]
MASPDTIQRPATVASAADLSTSPPGMRGRKLRGRLFQLLGLLSILVGLGTLLTLLLTVARNGLPWLDWQFLTSFDSRFPERAGLRAAVVGTLLTISITLVLALPIGIMSAIYLEEYERSSWFSRLIEVNINNLAGVPSIIYGLLALQVFVRWFGMGRSVLAGACTLALLILPIIIVASREAIRAVPQSIRQASYGLGATRWQTIWHHVLPSAFPSILTGTILGASRAIGETAPLITIGALTYVAFLPRDLFDKFTVLPIQIFNWISKPQDEFRGIAAAGILVLLVVLLLMNATAILLRQRLRRRQL